MYVLIENGQITKYFNNPKGFRLNDNQYAADIFSKWSKAEKEAIGIYEVEYDTSNKKDEGYYINTNEQFKFENNKVISYFGTATPKRLEDENAVDVNGDPVLQDGVQVINYGLKTEKKRIIKQQAAGLLAPTDWYVVKASEVADYTVPANITNYRAAVRTKSNEMENMINACTTVDALKALYDYVNTGTEQNPVYTRPLGEWPEEVI
jgi:hypothetical protein